jgi:hypothetical protein
MSCSRDSNSLCALTKTSSWILLTLAFSGYFPAKNEGISGWTTLRRLRGHDSYSLSENEDRQVFILAAKKKRTADSSGALQ